LPAHLRSVLILGGTGEAAYLAELLSGRPELRVITSLAGRTANPSGIAGETRIGGFGGFEGLARYLRDEQIDILVDATHPFAAKISEHARKATGKSGTPLLTLVRPAWERQTDDRWTVVRSLEEAAAALPANAHAFLALGRQHLAAFAARCDVRFVVRMVDKPVEALPLAAFSLITRKPGKTFEEEMALFECLDIDLLVSRNSGGRGAYAKIEAARRMGLPVIMIDRPNSPKGDAFADVEAIAAAIG